MVKKAAQVLGNKVNNSGNTARMPLIKSCNSPSHYIICNNCTDTLFGQIFEFLSCHQSAIKNLINIHYIKKSLIDSNICQQFGINVKEKSTVTVKGIEAFFPTPLSGAMCNYLAISFNKVHYNISHHYSNTTTDTVDISDINDKAPTEPVIKEIVATEPQVESSDSIQPDLPTIDLNTATIVDPIVEAVEVPAVVVEPTIEPIENEPEEIVDENVDKFMTELNTDSVATISTLVTTNNLQKESVFLRLSNRIKTLERNMSLSSQYLEELHKRYKKQVEDMQRVLEKTLQDVTIKQEERHKQIEEKLESLTRAMENLSKEKSQWKWFFCCLFVVFVCCFLYGARRFNRWKPAGAGAVAKSSEIQRRNSVDVVVSTKTNKKKKRRPSDQALKIVLAAGDQQKKKRKKSPMDGDWVTSRCQIIEDIPFPLEESDTSTLEPVNLVDSSRIDVPDYITTTAASVRLKRSMSMKNGKYLPQTTRVESSESSNNSLSSNEQSTPKKMRKGFKKLFKKVF
ncbi:unnamed protein product [Ceutorhynchus assimilis]|uniref:Uncharacterized protein n=1 Tax=Ceutorhynchus assimilis TaxID=467358 RepID=A0A9N9MYA9_9CUCU|nr:unnamed protein product [Ceutorhynchus assimilis]